MWEKIRSNIILKKIFYLIDLKTELIIIIYNKKIQRKLGLNLNDYKRCSGKYKEENDGKAKIYNSYNNRLLFEGEYSNGRKNGKGKEYNEEGKLLFEGEYLNDKKWRGEEKIYDKDRGIIIFEYEITNGKREGKFKKYDKYTERKIFSGKLINGEIKEGIECDTNGWPFYEGQYSNGQRNGTGILYYEKSKTIKYEGEFLNGNKHGKGIEYNLEHNLKYEGEFLNDKRNGMGKEYIKKNKDYYCKDYILIFEGIYFDNHRKKGKEYYKNNKLKFEGEYLFDKEISGKIYDFDGNIIFELNNNNGMFYNRDDGIRIYIGQNLKEKIKNEKINGMEYDSQGRFLFKGKYKYERKWEGKFKTYYKDKLAFEGEYLNGDIWSGKGKEYDSNHNVTFEGEYIKGKINGYLKSYNQYYNSDLKLSYEGYYINGLKNGYMKEYNYDGIKVFEGAYIHGERNGYGKEYNKKG